ncbi:MAG: flagellar motor protein MotD [Sulfuricellaceae bacterium]|nr:flagellar motor protein MotD [Sulfuricellaceae bacterium]
MARKKKHEEHENMERWLVSYADFITLLFAFFVVMYALSTLNEGKYKVLSQALIHAFQNPSQLVKREGAGISSQSIINKPQMVIIPKPMPDNPAKLRNMQKMKEIADDVLKVLDPLVKAGLVKITQSSRGIAIEINASVLFASGEAKLAPSSIKVLSSIGEVLSRVPNPIQVEGYTDNAPIATALFPSNWELSTARASSVVRLFAQNGVAEERLVAVGYAENHPVKPNDTPEGRARNRRVNVMILPEPDDAAVPSVERQNSAGVKN